ncbi:AAA family ATPase [Parathalassolituus penaei]|uniref:ATP-binding protein n=1 Tax=Parathalassolituus penaei TaxID=2997323 RepID=A0A9X3EC56_9GAMM|nr:ATP-binding protein [Parathalassolituus penaei]MCY0964859.1 ATP-binding protein [Parathalassolituus penaei]
MLIEFRVTNFRSFKDEQKFSLVRGTGDELLASNSFTANDANQMPLLRSAAIYGPNASGKSNFLKALRAMKKIVMESALKGQRGDRLSVEPYRLSRATKDKPSEFEATFIAEGIRYQYGFSVTSQRVEDEWLFAFPKKRQQVWFQRAWNSETDSYEWDIGNQLIGKKQVWQTSTRSNALFLSTAVQLNSEQLKPVFDWFRKTLRLAQVGGWDSGYTADLCENEESKSRVMEFLRAADIAIDDISIERTPFNPADHLPNDMPDPLKEMIAEELKDKQLARIQTIHLDEDDNPVIFDMKKDESDGTQKLFGFAGPWLDALENGYVLFIDELHGNLHPELVRFLVGLFNNSETNPNNAQLVFSTHETSILSQKCFRRDQIWFCEKSTETGSQLYSLFDIRGVIKDRSNLALAYLSGRYGALPFVRDLNLQ